ncbi:hypothetical protein CB0940_01865 [Cercospora beticola]|uniref:Zn(2)-C6 fungal-type domain-containing protein n=1 Tax=Cercospora beticola TaxID=122368 RepID=A0A2G5I923_CERBT|nr:hypothetical protein CB0940_01865 [Cercospora beticola]PIB01270.1 hypothetical protein CB0940_01865 [Cercospora beticola]WPA97320.1 hypothetical protein RHO25_001929 [Cercospora beticola]
MTGPNSPTSAKEKTFRFISDPGHKENLSGRVRAACLTCRRKKIKCSGELNCRTCREKGLVCEGLPERKRPRRDSSSTFSLSAAAAGVKRRKTEIVDKLAKPAIKAKPRTESPKPRETLPMDPRIAQARVGEAILSPSLTEPPLPSVNVKITYKQAQPPQRAFYMDSWQLQDDASSSSETKHKPALQPQAQTLRTADTTASAGNGTPSFQLQFQLPEHAVDFQPADGTPVMPTFDNTSRRQTIAFPLPSPDSALEQQRDPFAGGGGAYDDIATLLYARMGMTPGNNDFVGWWETNPELTSLLPQEPSQAATAAQIPPPQPQQIPMQQQTAQPPPATRLSSAGDYFDHWHGWAGE